MNVTRIRQPDVVAIRTATRRIERRESQVFYKTDKAWELWQEKPSLWFIRRWDRRAVLWIHTD